MPIKSPLRKGSIPKSLASQPREELHEAVFLAVASLKHVMTEKLPHLYCLQTPEDFARYAPFGLPVIDHGTGLLIHIGEFGENH